MTLLQQGVPEDDLSLVAGNGASQDAKSLERAASTPESDASAFVGRADDPVRDQLIPPAKELEAKFAIAEAPYGGGISTDTLDDSAETVDQATEPNELAEDMLERPEWMTEARRELHDLDMAVMTGFPSSPTTDDTFQSASVLPVDDYDRSLEEIAVERLGVVAGGGAMATAALDYADNDPSNDEDAMMRHFREEGVPDIAAHEYLEAIKHGAAVISVGLIPGEVDAPLVEEVADRLGAESARTYDAPRF
jgi:hypothetical protein